jgi:hypothetical protein
MVTDEEAQRVKFVIIRYAEVAVKVVDPSNGC